jgi:hypothetical protein
MEFAKNLLPSAVKEGSSIQIDDNGIISLIEDSERERRIASKMNAVWR